MNKAIKNLLIIGLVLFFLTGFSFEARAEAAASSAETLPAPTLIAPLENSILGDNRLIIVGLVKSRSLVKIFIDDVLVRQSLVLTHESGTANFAYLPEKKLSLGWHKLYIVAQDLSGRASPATPTINFKVEPPFPAPTMLKPVVNDKTIGSRPFIVGLAKNDSKIKIYIDKKLDGEFEVKNDKSGTANFAYKPSRALSRGNHLVYAEAVDRRGKISIKSNSAIFTVRIGAIAQAASEEPDAKPEPKAPDVSAEEPKSIGNFEKNQNNSGAAKGLIESGVSRLANGWGIINETKQSQGSLNTGVVLFIMFLVGVVAWLIWVNRELIKEQRARNQAGEIIEVEKDKLDERRNKLL